MTVWWITLASSYLLCLVAGMNAKTVYSNGYYTKKYNKFFSFMSVAILVLVAGLRSGIGDTPTYIQGYKTDAPSTIAGSIKLLFSGKKDAGFYFYQGILKSIVNNPNVFIFVTSLITIVLIFITYYKYSQLLELSVFLFITTGCYLVTMNGIRQYLASAILFFCFPLIHERKWYIYIPIVLICSTIHKSALVFIILYFIVDQPAWGHTTKWILFIGIALFVTYPVSGPMIAKLLGETQYGEYKNVLVSTGAGANMIRVLVMAVPIVLSYLGRDFLKGRERYYNIIVNYSVINLIFILLATKFWIYARFNMYFSVYMIILITWCVRYMFDERNTKFMYLMCLGLYFVYYYYEMHISLGFGVGYHHFIQAVGIGL